MSRIGNTLWEQLKWVLDNVDRELPRSDPDWLNLWFEAHEFAGPADTPDGRAEEVQLYIQHNLADMLETFRHMIDFATWRHRITGLPRPPAPELAWDAAAQRYRKEFRDRSESFGTRALGELGELLEAYGHLVKRCQAPARLKPGRKKKGAAAEAGLCNKRFLATRETQIYCSSACLARTVERKKAARSKAPARPARKKKQTN